jgi:hypothetical protein
MLNFKIGVFSENDGGLIVVHFQFLLDRKTAGGIIIAAISYRRAACKYRVDLLLCQFNSNNDKVWIITVVIILI